MSAKDTGKFNQYIGKEADKRNLTYGVFKGPHVLDIVDKDFKIVILHMFKEEKETHTHTYIKS